MARVVAIDNLGNCIAADAVYRDQNGNPIPVGGQVQTPVGSSTVSANNGLTENPTDNIQLGGLLIQPTTITTAGQPFDFTSNSAAEPTLDLTNSAPGGLGIRVDGEATLVDFPNTRNDGVPANILFTGPGGQVQSTSLASLLDGLDGQANWCASVSSCLCAALNALPIVPIPT